MGDLMQITKTWSWWWTEHFSSQDRTSNVRTKTTAHLYHKYRMITRSTNNVDKVYHRETTRPYPHPYKTSTHPTRSRQIDTLTRASDETWGIGRLRRLVFPLLENQTNEKQQSVENEFMSTRESKRCHFPTEKCFQPGWTVYKIWLFLLKKYSQF